MRRQALLAGLVALAWILGGCAQSLPTPTASGAAATASPPPAATRTATVAPSPTVTPSPTATTTPSPSATPTRTPGTRTPGPPPHVLASYPLDGDLAVVDQRPLVIVFDQPMDAASVQSHVTLSPTMDVEASWPDNSTLHLQPQAPWPSELPFELTVAEGARSATGGVLTEPFRLRFAAGGRGVRLPILMYHHILDLPADASEGQRTWTVSPAAFSEQMRYLIDHGWRTIGPSALAAYLTDGTPLPPHTLMITMDDGYREVYTTALPLLRNTPLRPVLFIIPETMGYGAYLDWEQLEELVAAGFWVGCHSYDHSNLRGLSAAELDMQLGESRGLLEEQLGLAIEAFCYPFGSYDDDTLAALSGYGYRTAYTLNPTNYQDPGAPLQLGRRRIDYATTLEDFIALVEP